MQEKDVIILVKRRKCFLQARDQHLCDLFLTVSWDLYASHPIAHQLFFPSRIRDHEDWFEGGSKEAHITSEKGDH